MADDLRQFMRDIALRHERIWQEVRKEVDARSRRLDSITAELNDTRDERRADTAALWALVERLQNGGNTA